MNELLDEMQVLLDIRREQGMEAFRAACQIMGWDNGIFCYSKGLAEIWSGPSWRGVTICDTVEQLRSILLARHSDEHGR